MGLLRLTVWHAAAAIAAAAAVPAHGQVVLDGTLGPAGPRVGPNYVIPQSVGRLEGTNLFHSFSQFNVGRGESATFTASQGVAVSNVVARVTGGSPSNIDGLLRSAIPDANLVLVNPAGIAFGEGARLDVQGAFVATTAHDVAFADGARFAAAGDLAGSTFTAAPPRAFGFLAGRTPAPISYTGGPSQQAGLEVPAGRSLSIVGGGVRIVGGRVQSVGGRVSVVSVASAGTVALDPGDGIAAPAFDGFDQLGPVDLLDGASVSGPAGGRVVIRGRDLNLDRSSLLADTDLAPGGGIDVDLAGALTARDATISSQTTGPAPGGPIRLRAAEAVRISGVTAENEPPVSASTLSSGRGGDVTVETASLSISRNAAIIADVGENAATGPDVTGDGGDIDITATRDLLIDGTGAFSLTGIAAQTYGFSTGRSGNITIRTPRLTMIDKGEVTSTTRTSARAGDITVLTGERGQVTIEGRGATTLTGIQSRVGNGPADAAAAEGRGGTITVQTGTLRLTDYVVITATTFGRGDGGDIDVTAGEFTATHTPAAEFTGLFARSERVDARANGGTITVRADRVRLAGGAQISSVSNGRGNAGGVVVAATEFVELDGGSLVSVAADGPGDASGAPAAGDIDLTGGRRIELFGGSSVAASATGSGGNIRLQARDRVRLVDSQITGEARLGDGGRILIDPAAVVLDRSLINGLAGGRDVRVQIEADAFLTSQSRILTDTAVLPPEVDIAGSLARLPGGLTSAAARLQEVCGMRFRGELLSTFFAPGRGGTPPEPAGWQTGLTLWGGLERPHEPRADGQ